MGGAGIASGAYTIIAFAVPPGQRPAFTGLLGASYGCASVIGPLLGGVFTSHATWRWCFYVNLPIGGASAGVILLLFQAPTASKPVKASWREKILQMDPLGTFTIMAAIVCFLLALQWGGVTKAWSDPSVVGTLVGFGLLLIVFGVVEWYMGDRAVLQGALLGRREISVNCLYIFLYVNISSVDETLLIELSALPGLSSFCSTIFRSTSNLWITSRLPRVEFGTYHSCWVLVSSTAEDLSYAQGLTFLAFCTIVSGGIITAYGVYVPFLLAGSAIATIGAGLLYTLDIGSPSSHWIGYQALTGIGIGLSIQVPIIANQAFVKPAEISSVTAVTLCKSIIVRRFKCARVTSTNSSLSFPNHRRRRICIRGSSSLHQPINRADPNPCPRRQSRSGGSNGRNRVASCIFSRTDPRHRARLHGRTEIDLRFGSRIDRGNPSRCAVREVAER